MDEQTVTVPVPVRKVVSRKGEIRHHPSEQEKAEFKNKIAEKGIEHITGPRGGYFYYKECEETGEPYKVYCRRKKQINS